MTAPTPEEFERHLHEGPTLPEFILARVAEWEAAARAAIDPDRPGVHWQWVRTHDDVATAMPTWEDMPVSLRTIEEFPTEVVGDLPAFVLNHVEVDEPRALPHIARHDPARVLAQCAAYRTIVERAVAHRKRSKKAWKEYSRWLQGKPVPEPGTPAHASDGDVSKEHDAILRALATIWADHADYDERWRD